MAARRKSQPKRVTSQETPKCLLGKYWCEQFQKAGLDASERSFWSCSSSRNFIQVWR